MDNTHIEIMIIIIAITINTYMALMCQAFL